MSADIWTLDRDLCRCCHAEGIFNNLAEPRGRNAQKEIYSDMLKDCFEINILPVPGTLCEITYTICEACILRLKDAFDFMKQVQKCEEKFKDFYNRDAIKARENSNGTDIKVEMPEYISDCKDDYPMDYEEDFINFDNDEPRKEEILPKVVIAKKGKGTSKAKAKIKTDPQKKESSCDKEDTTDVAVRKKGGKTASQFRLLSQDFKKDGDSYLCGHCDKRYDKISSLRFHLKTNHYKIPRYFCELCKKEFMTLAPFTVHKLEEHNIDDRFKCKACKGTFNTKIQLRKHINNFHMLGERYKCDFCDYESFSFEGMYKHKFKHKTVKDYHCQFCRKSFLRKTTLDLHVRIHTGDRRKVCKECGQAFVQKASLNYHMTKYHPGVNF
ncbi:zinc finger protein 676-like isoform X3 [Battus philenor]|uniref:zinc finger protein 676-like isoform X3 n=1 Tax=Battus philenor TaxID=42288 RepID=UPI0035D03196